MDDSKKIYSKSEMYEWIISCIKTAKLYNVNFKIENALRNYRGRLAHEIQMTIHSTVLNLKIQTLEHIDSNFKEINKRVKSEFK